MLLSPDPAHWFSCCQPVHPTLCTPASFVKSQHIPNLPRIQRKSRWSATPYVSICSDHYHKIRCLWRGDLPPVHIYDQAFPLRAKAHLVDFAQKPRCRNGQNFLFVITRNDYLQHRLFRWKYHCFRPHVGFMESCCYSSSCSNTVRVRTSALLFSIVGEALI